MRRTWLAVLGIAGAAWIAWSPVLWRWKEPSTVDPSDTLLVVLNPLRERGSERAAEEVLRRLRSGRCLEALSFVPRDGRLELCERERQVPVQSWQLLDRDGTRAEPRLLFAVTRRPHADVRTDVWITVRREKNDWVPARYVCAY